MSITRWGDIFRRYSVRPTATAAGSIGNGLSLPILRGSATDISRMREQIGADRRKTRTVMRGASCSRRIRPAVRSSRTGANKPGHSPALLQLRPHQMQDRSRDGSNQPPSAFGSTQRSEAGVSASGGASAGKPLVSSGVASVTTVIELGESTIMTETPVGILGANHERVRHHLDVPVARPREVRPDVLSNGLSAGGLARRSLLGGLIGWRILRGGGHGPAERYQDQDEAFYACASP